MAAALRLRDIVRDQPLAMAEGALAAVLALATLSLAGSLGAEQPTIRAQIVRAHMTRQFSSIELTRISTGMSPYAVSTAERIDKGVQGWTPTGVEGWGIYDLTPPSLLHHELSYDDARSLNALIQPTSTPITAMKPFILNTGDDDYNRALQCLSQAVYYEAGFETGEGQEAVAQVVLNRLRHPAYPKTVCGVVYQGSSLPTGCQFSFTCDGSLARQPADAAWKNSRDVAMRALHGFVYAPVGTATHYHADYVFPYWAVTLVKLKQIGAHIFYRMTGPSGAADDFDGKYEGGEAIISPTILTGGDTRTPDAPSAIISPTILADTRPEPRLVTLTIGGETKTYAVASGNSQPALPDTGAPNSGDQSKATQVGPTAPPIAGTLTTTRRLPTPEEIQAINEKVRQLQMQQSAGTSLPAIKPVNP